MPLKLSVSLCNNQCVFFKTVFKNICTYAHKTYSPIPANRRACAINPSQSETTPTQCLKKIKSITTYNMLIFKPYALISAHMTYSPISANRKAYAITPSQSETTPTQCLKKIKSITTYNMLIFKPYALISAHMTYSPISANRKAYVITPSQSETTPTQCLKKIKSITTYNMLIFKPYALISAHMTYSPISANRKAYAITPSQSETTPTQCLKKIKSITTYNMLIFKPYALISAHMTYSPISANRKAYAITPSQSETTPTQCLKK